MNGVNRILFGGRLTAKPVTGKNNSGIAYADFTLESERIWHFQGKERRETATIACQAWHKLAELVATFDQGDTVMIDGRIQCRKILQADGSTVTRIVAVADSVWRVAKNHEELMTATK